MEDFVTQNVLLGLVTSMIMQWMKKSRFIPLLAIPVGETADLQQHINLCVSWVAAVLVSVGIHYTWHYDGKDHFELAFSGTMSGLRSGVWEVIKQWCSQHGMYKLVVVLPELLGKIVATQSQLVEASKEKVQI